MPEVIRLVEDGAASSRESTLKHPTTPPCCIQQLSYLHNGFSTGHAPSDGRGHLLSIPAARREPAVMPGEWQGNVNYLWKEWTFPTISRLVNWEMSPQEDSLWWHQGESSPSWWPLMYSTWPEAQISPFLGYVRGAT